ncbi:hypothetical protein DL546_001305 [Coniochaeta pulveracea]|uniref:Enoyl-CoA hydratase n=1 Tax=Coniochaeta pulveracea TaxID=177199 RepID=A0A420XWX5_9PEZI|nr:hypothetical protein DL546_001305 [Coniochaeta pulveracea]
MAPRPAQHFENFDVTFPDERIVQVTINRPQKLNCIDKATSREIAKIWDLLDNDENLWVGIITGAGRAFCTGADLGEWNKMNATGEVNSMAAPGLAGLPRRTGKKPIIAAVNGICMGGGFEMVTNCDIVIAASTAVFSLPEVKRGIVPVAGCLPRLTRTLGLQRTMELVLTGKTVEAKVLHEWGLVNQLVSGGEEELRRVAVEWAKGMCANSPDALVVGRLGVRSAWEAGSVEDTVTMVEENWYPRLVQGENFREGIKAFAEKRAPVWRNSKL